MPSQQGLRTGEGKVSADGELEVWLKAGLTTGAWLGLGENHRMGDLDGGKEQGEDLEGFKASCLICFP